MSYFANPFFVHLRTINNLSTFLLSCRSSPGKTGMEENANTKIDVCFHYGNLNIQKNSKSRSQ